MISQKIVQQELKRKGEVRFAFDMTPEKYKKFVKKVIDEYSGSIVRSITDYDIFEDYGISPEIQRKVKTQLAKAVNELKKVVELIR